MTPIFYGQVKDGKLILEKRDRLDKWLLKLKGRVRLVVEKATPAMERTVRQNAYYWGVVIKMLVEAGHFTIDDDAHDYLKRLFLKRGVDFKGKRYEVVGSTTTLTTIDMENYLEKCRLWAAQELQIVIPYPNEVTEDSY